MEPGQFRESRLEINRLVEKIISHIDKKSFDDSKLFFDKAVSLLEVLIPQAEGEIQKRSVKNLRLKMSGLSSRIKKIQPKGKTAGKGTGASSYPAIEWNEERIGQLSVNFLEKVFSNMRNNEEARVFFSTTGKGVRPSYQIEFGNDEITAFSGSGHSPLKRTYAPNSSKISQPFSHDLIHSIIRENKG